MGLCKNVKKRSILYGSVKICQIYDLFKADILRGLKYGRIY